MLRPKITKTAIITGAGQGIGYQIAIQLAEEGYNLIINDLDTNLLQNLALKIGAKNCKIVAGDCSKIEVIDDLIKTAIDNFGQLTTIIANAGITTFGKFLDYEPSSLDALLNLNIKGTFFLVQRAARQMERQKSGGQIVLTSSVTGHLAHENLVAYGMTKAAIEQLAKNLVVELAPLQITVNCVAPGFTETERTLKDEIGTEVWNKITPMLKVAKVQDIADLVCFLVSDKAKHITGQSIVVDGGWTAVGQSPYGPLIPMEENNNL
jgi:glucose 1-dehydrogenase